MVDPAPSCSFSSWMRKTRGCFLGLGCGVADLLMLKDRVLDLEFCLGVLEGVLVTFLCLVPEPDLILPVGGNGNKRKLKSGQQWKI